MTLQRKFHIQLSYKSFIEDKPFSESAAPNPVVEELPISAVPEQEIPIKDIGFLVSYMPSCTVVYLIIGFLCK